MAIDVVIKQTIFGRKTMPLEVILGEYLRYGNFVNDQLKLGELGETEFIAYNPESIGRGFSVIWNPDEKRSIALRLPQPSTIQEIKDFYASIERMVQYWNGKMVVDGKSIKLREFLDGFDNMVAFNYKIIHQFSQQVLDGEHDTLTLYSAMWPLSIGKEEASLFIDNPDAYAKWLHEKQSMDVCFASPHFYAGDAGVFARYVLTDNLPIVLPLRPTVPFGMIDPQTGKPLECKDWRIWIGLAGKGEPLCEMEYETFLSRIPAHKKSGYDGSHFLLTAMTEKEIKEFKI